LSEDIGVDKEETNRFLEKREVFCCGWCRSRNIGATFGKGEGEYVKRLFCVK
jgi:hypothetical protein